MGCLWCERVQLFTTASNAGRNQDLVLRLGGTNSSFKAQGGVFARVQIEVTLKNPTGPSQPSSLVAATQAGVALLFISLSPQGCLAIWQGAWH